jgi:Putative MetA-pathway of phenol degradation
MRFLTAGFIGVFLFALLPCRAQNNYEIQVYESGTVPNYSTMFELHSNVTLFGSNQSVNGVVPSQYAWHETVEITQGLTPWFEVGTYLFLSGYQGNFAPHWVGDHIRPRIRVPDKWKWPLGLSLSAEVGYQKREFSEDTWTLEIRPVIDKEYKNFYVSFNPAIDYSIQGLNHNAGPQFSPAVKVSYKFCNKVEVGVEYYGSIGAFKSIDPLKEQQHQIGPSVDIDISPVWEINVGYIFGLTPATDKGILKLILGRRADWKKHPKKPASTKTI